MTEFNLDLKALRSCLPAMSDDESREYLCGVHIFERDDDIIYEATNGHILVRVIAEAQYQDFDCTGLRIILPAFIVKQLCKGNFMKPFGVEGDFVPCHVDDTRINIEMLNGVINFKLVDGEYPEIDRIIPKRSNIVFNKINVNGKYMDALSKSVAVYTNTRVLSLNFTGDRYGCPILIQDDAAENWIGLLMPVTLFDAESDEGEQEDNGMDPLIPEEDGPIEDNDDEMYQKAKALVEDQQKASISFVQRNLQIGYNRAARLIDRMEKEKIISPPSNLGKRIIL